MVSECIFELVPVGVAPVVLLTVDSVEYQPENRKQYTKKCAPHRDVVDQGVKGDPGVAYLWIKLKVEPNSVSVVGVDVVYN